MQKRKNFIVVGVVVLLAITVLVGVVLLRNWKGGGYEKLPINQFMDSPRSYAGNTYAYEGHIDKQVGYSDSVGRVLLTQDSGRNVTVPIFVSNEITGFNPSVGQLYRFVLFVDADGCLSVKSFKKL
jgi:hypothetical protein